LFAVKQRAWLPKTGRHVRVNSGAWSVCKLSVKIDYNDRPIPTCSTGDERCEKLDNAALEQYLPAGKWIHD
jgi:hypothetical protein